MYDFDSNNILGKPIKSRDKSELIRGFEMCYKELQEANITPILHRLDNEVSDDLIEAIKKKKLNTGKNRALFKYLARIPNP